jgi:hypothetical protein
VDLLDNGGSYLSLLGLFFFAWVLPSRDGARFVYQGRFLDNRELLSSLLVCVIGYRRFHKAARIEWRRDLEDAPCCGTIREGPKGGDGFSLRILAILAAQRFVLEGESLAWLDVDDIRSSVRGGSGGKSLRVAPLCFWLLPCDTLLISPFPL